MTVSTGPRSAHSASKDSIEAAAELVQKLDVAGASVPRVIVFFAALEHDGAVLGDTLRARFPGAEILGCSSNGEFTEQGYGKGGVAALVLGEELVEQAVSGLAMHDQGVEPGIVACADRLGAALKTPLRELDPHHYAGIALLEGAKGREEQINEALGNVAPLLGFVGGSAGDNIKFQRTWVYAEGRLESDATALLVMKLRVPFAVVKTCNFIATPVEFTVTRADPERRLIYELDGQPAIERYAAACGVRPEELGFPQYLANPLGLMIDGEPWLRSAAGLREGALFFACSVLEGMTLNLMQATDIVDNARAAFERATVELGTPPRAALLFNCAYRMFEVQIKGVETAYHAALSSVVHAGLHSNGESYLGHINQTLTGLVIG